MSRNAIPATKESIRKEKEPIRKELTQCQYCYKSRLSGGASLSKCSACQIALYCSKECQKAAWPTHKVKCKLNQRQLALPAVQVDALKTLRAFTTKHRPTLSYAGIRALDICVDRSRSMRDVVLVFVKPRPDTTKVETAFVVEDARVVPLSYFPAEQAEEIRGQLKYINDEGKRMGEPGGIMVILIDNESRILNAVGIGFGTDVDQLQPGQPWKEHLMDRLNNGIVM